MIFNKLFAVLPFVASTFGKALESRAVYDFTLYGYAKNITGFPVVSINDTAYLSGYTPGIIPNARNVSFDLAATRGNFTATIENEDESRLLYVPSTSGSVGFTNTTDNDTLITTGFGFYGHVAFLQSGSSILTEWYAVPTNDGQLYLLTWDNEANGIPVALRNLSPTTL